jgi:hypothetical protein
MLTADPSKTHGPEPLKPSALPRDITLTVGGALGIVVIVAVAIAVRPVPFEDLDSAARADSSGPSGTTRASAGASDEGEAPVVTAEAPSGTSRELRAKLSREVRQGKLKDAVSAFEALAAADPRSAEDVDVRGDLLELATKAEYAGGREADRVFEVLSSKLGGVGVDVLYALVTGKGGSKAATRAESLLRQEDVRKRASAGTRIAFDMWAAKSCEAKAALLDRAKDEGDSRTLGWLTVMRRSCNMSKDPKVDAAMDAIRSRMR